jgi:hypothetical protein
MLIVIAESRPAALELTCHPANAGYTLVELPEKLSVARDDLRRDDQERGMGFQGRPWGDGAERCRSDVGCWDGQDR